MEFDKIIIVGCTHGNEWTGEGLIKRHAKEITDSFPNLPIEFLMANPSARNLNKRYVDEDLNRVFRNIEADIQNHERTIAKNFLEKIEKQKVLIIDIHTSTSNLGNTLIITQEAGLNFELAKQVSESTGAKVIFSPDVEKKYLVSQSSWGLMIEIGPVEHNTYQDQAIHDALEMTKKILERVSLIDENIHGTIKLYKECKDILYPSLEGIKIHPDFDRSDFKSYHHQCVAFLNENTMELLNIEYEGEFFPIFIGEASYLENSLAFSICEQIEMTY